jgi:hypothetical protein
MEKFSTKRTYLSSNVLGQLYRHCDRYGIGMQSRADLEITAEPNGIFNLEGIWILFLNIVLIFGYFFNFQLF